MTEKNAKNYAVYLLEKRDYGETELFKKISEKYTEEDAAEAVAYVVERGYVNDEKYARRLAEKYFISYGKKRVSEELFRKGLGREVISNAIEEAYDENREIEKITKLINQKTKNTFPQGKKERDKLFAFLFRKGFSASEITETLRTMKENIDYEIID